MGRGLAAYLCFRRKLRRLRSSCKLPQIARTNQTSSTFHNFPRLSIKFHSFPSSSIKFFHFPVFFHYFSISIFSWENKSSDQHQDSQLAVLAKLSLKSWTELGNGTLYGKKMELFEILNMKWKKNGTFQI